MTASKIIRRVAKETPSYKSYESKKISIAYDDGENRNTFSGQIRLERNENITITLKKMTLPLGRGYITPDSLFLVNYFEKYFVAEDIETMKSILGFDLNFDLLQALITADVSSLLQNKEFDKELISYIDENMYRIDSQFDSKIDRALNKGNEKRLNRYMEKMDDSEFIDYTVWIDPVFFVIRKLNFNNIKYKESLTLLFDQYELVGRSLYPQHISLEMRNPKQKMAVDLKLSKPSVNKESDMHFSIPDKYEKYKLAN